MRNFIFFLLLFSVEAHALGTIAPAECEEMKKKVGQLFYINVDGFGSNYTVHPAYEALIKKMQPGGVLPHYNSKDITAIRKASLRLQAQSNLPLMIGVDYQSMNGAQIGLGYGAGLASEISNSDVACFEKVAKIEAALHQYAGINNPLGPTVEYNTKDSDEFPAKPLDYRLPRLNAIVDSFRDAGLETTLKHFPYTPADYNLHKTSKDTKIPVADVDKDYLPGFRELAGKSGFVMTTHLYNSEVDPANMATFSKVWMKKLRDDVGFKGIAMTDALFMINNYPDTMKQMSRDWPAHLSGAFNKDLSIFAIKSILAGHDMVFLETAAAETEKTWSDVGRFACTDDPLAKEFRHRVRESYDRITNYKKENAQLKDTSTKLTDADVTALIAARKQKERICDSEDKNLDAILAKIKRTPTKIDDFKCESPSVATSPISEELNNLSTLAIASAKAVIIKSTSSQNPDDLNLAIQVLSKNPDLRNAIREQLIADTMSSDPQVRSPAFTAIGKLDLLDEDKSILNNIIARNDTHQFAEYLRMMKSSKISPVDANTSLATRVAFFQSYMRANPIDLSNNNLKESLALIETLFPSEFVSKMTKADVDKLGLTGDYALLFKYRMSDIELTNEEQIRFVEIFAKNRRPSSVSLPSLISSEDSEPIDFFDYMPDHLDVSELTLTPPKKNALVAELNSAISQETQNAFRRSHLQVMKVMIQKDPAITTAAINENVIKLLPKIAAADEEDENAYLEAEALKSLKSFAEDTHVPFPPDKKAQLIDAARKASKENNYLYYEIREMFPDDLKD